MIFEESIPELDYFKEQIKHQYDPVIIVPYRARQSHLDAFIPVMKAYLPKAPIFILEQSDTKPFNRGKLCNVGFLETMLVETDPSYFVIHDIDMLPIDVDYSFGQGVTQLVDSEIQLHDYLGGVTMFSKETFEIIGGYNNDYFCRAEDNEMMFNLRRLNISIIERIGKFEQLPHERTGPEFIPHLWVKAQRRRAIQNQLGVCRYTLVSKEEREEYTLLRVEL